MPLDVVRVQGSNHLSQEPMLRPLVAREKAQSQIAQAIESVPDHLFRLAQEQD
jgi:hypothetical protein